MPITQLQGGKNMYLMHRLSFMPNTIHVVCMCKCDYVRDLYLANVPKFVRFVCTICCIVLRVCVQLLLTF